MYVCMYKLYFPTVKTWLQKVIFPRGRLRHVPLIFNYTLHDHILSAVTQAKYLQSTGISAKELKNKFCKS